MTNDLSIKEIFDRVADFKTCPRTLKWEMGYLATTMKRWYKEGLPRQKDEASSTYYGVFGEAYPMPVYHLHDFTGRERNDVSAYFDLDEGFIGLPVNFWFEPPFEDKVFYEEELYKEVQDGFGIRKKNFKDESSMPQWIGFPVKTREDWERIKEEKLTFKGIKERTYPDIDIDNLIKEIKEKNVPSFLNYYPMGYFGSLRYLFGDEKLLMTYYDDPCLIKDIAEHLTNLWLAMDEELTAKLDFDVLYFWEDMSYRGGSLISPAMVREFMLPYYKRIIDFAKSKGINHVFVDTDGYVDELIPLFMEVGFNIFSPFERQAGNDIIAYRKKYPELIMMGGFDKTTFYKGREYIDKELEVMRDIIKMGGFIPHVDHWVPHNVSWEDFVYYREKLNKIIDSTQVL